MEERRRVIEDCGRREGGGSSEFTREEKGGQRVVGEE
jgi:hypothetical protein